MSSPAPVRTGYPAARNRGRDWSPIRELDMQTIAFKAGDTIISEGDQGDGAFFIVTGWVEVFIGRDAGARSVGKLGTGEVFGEMSLIEPGPRSATVKAMTDVECLAASYAEFIDAIETHPERAVAFMKTLVRRLRQMNELLEKAGPDKRTLREIVQDCQKSLEPGQFNADVKAIAWTMLW
jgi:CRP/FNR family transcriptional regulator, cyclic AMP receptor protein